MLPRGQLLLGVSLHFSLNSHYLPTLQVTRICLSSRSGS